MFRMNKLVTTRQMKLLEQNTFDMGVAPITVMETAAAAVSGYILQKFGKCRVAVICGKGNNGGDGLACARQLSAEGCGVTVILAFGEVKTPDAITNLNILKKTGISFSDTIPEDTEVIIDAVFGTGICGGAELPIFEEINKRDCFVVSVDVPSGVCPDTGSVQKGAVIADATVTFGYKKVGLTQFPAKKYCGEIIVAPIFLSDCIPFDTFEMDTCPDMPGLEVDSHKGTNGRLLVIAGSTGMTGAAYLSCISALRCGCGLVTLAIPENLNPIMEVKLTESMTLPLKCHDRITFEAFDKIDISGYDCILIGPGLGVGVDVFRIIEKLAFSGIPLIIDADGINSLKPNIDILKESSNIVLTPHPGEFARLTGIAISEVQQNRIALAREFAENYGVTLVLKGAGTVVAEKGGKCYINTTGNCGMATGGSGDVLAGIIGGLTARKVKNASLAGVYIHGLAGDIALENSCAESILPTDTVDMITKALQKIKK